MIEFESEVEKEAAEFEEYVSNIQEKKDGNTCYETTCREQPE